MEVFKKCHLDLKFSKENFRSLLKNFSLENFVIFGIRESKLMFEGDYMYNEAL